MFQKRPPQIRTPLLSPQCCWCWEHSGVETPKVALLPGHHGCVIPWWRSSPLERFSHSAQFAGRFSLNPAHIFVVSVSNYQQLPRTRTHKITTSLFLSEHTLTKSYSRPLLLLSWSIAQEPPMVPSVLKIKSKLLSLEFRPFYKLAVHYILGGARCT